VRPLRNQDAPADVANHRRAVFERGGKEAHRALGGMSRTGNSNKPDARRYGVIIRVARGDGEGARAALGPPLCCAGCDTGHGATRGVLLNYIYHSGYLCSQIKL
jgi:hypothetical protein